MADQPLKRHKDVGKAAMAFKIDGELLVEDSTTVICLRRAPDAGVPKKASSTPFGAAMFAGRDDVEFTSGWQVLMGQAEVKNWMRSGRDTDVTMRYPGEFKFAGGKVDEGESIREAGVRELAEEFLAPIGVQLPDDASIRPFLVKQTNPIRSKSNLMYNFLALERENPWLAELDVDQVNAGLAERRAAHAALVESGAFWEMDQAEKEAVAPEIRQLAWVDLHQAFSMTLATMNDEVQHINDFQREEFERYGVKRRDPMFMSAVTLFELEAFPNEESLMAEFPLDRSLDGMARDVQWLFTGMTNEDFENAPPAKLSMMKSIDQVEVEQAERRAQGGGVSAAGASAQSAMGGRAVHRRLGALGTHLVASEVEEAVELYSNPDPTPLEYTPSDPEAIVRAMETDGVALLEGVLSLEDAAHLSSLLSAYEPLPHEERLKKVGVGKEGSGQNLTTLFQRDADWLKLVDPEPIAAAMDAILGDTCHLVSQKGWRHAPGHNTARGAAPGIEGDGFHTDELFNGEMPEEIAMDPRYKPPILIITALSYLNGTTPELCPT